VTFFNNSLFSDQPIDVEAISSKRQLMAVNLVLTDESNTPKWTAGGTDSATRLFVSQSA